MNRFGLKEEDSHLVLQHLEQCLFPSQKLRVWICGARTKGHFQGHEPLEIILEATPKVSPGQFSEIQTALKSLNLTIPIQLEKFEELTPQRLDIVLKERVLVHDFG